MGRSLGTRIGFYCARGRKRKRRMKLRGREGGGGGGRKGRERRKEDRWRGGREIERRKE